MSRVYLCCVKLRWSACLLTSTRKKYRTMPKSFIINFFINMSFTQMIWTKLFPIMIISSTYISSHVIILPFIKMKKEWSRALLLKPYWRIYVKPGAKSLFKTIKRFFEFAYSLWCVLFCISRGLFHVDLFFKICLFRRNLMEGKKKKGREGKEEKSKENRKKKKEKESFKSVFG